MPIYGPPTRTVGEVFRAVRRTFGDESSAQLEDADMVAWINDAQDEINNENKILKETADIAAVPGQTSYTFPSNNIQQIEAVLVAGIPVRNVTYSQALESYVGQDTVAGQPEVWYEWGGKFTFYPVPSTTDAITLVYTKRPTPVTTAASVLSVPDKYYQDVIRYVLSQAYLMDEAVDLAGNQTQQFAASLNAKGEEERTAAHMTYSVITLVD